MSVDLQPPELWGNIFLLSKPSSLWNFVLLLFFSCSVVSDSVIPWTAACQAFLSFTVSWSLLKLMSIESVMPSNHLILYLPLLLLSSIFPSTRVFYNEPILHIRWPKYWSFSFIISPSNNIQGWFPLGWTGLSSLQSKVLSRGNALVLSKPFSLWNFVIVAQSNIAVVFIFNCHNKKAKWLALVLIPILEVKKLESENLSDLPQVT